MKVGECLSCKTMMIKEGKLLPNYRILKFRLSNGTIMTVAICADCLKKGIALDNYKTIMQQVRDGWQAEFDTLKWDTQKIEDYKKRYFNLEITGVAV